MKKVIALALVLAVMSVSVCAFAWTTNDGYARTFKITNSFTGQEWKAKYYSVENVHRAGYRIIFHPAVMDGTDTIIDMPYEQAIIENLTTGSPLPK